MAWNVFRVKPELFKRMLAVLVLVVPALFWACSGSSSSTSSARANAPQTIQVTAAAAKRQDLPVYLTGLGSAQAYFTVSIKSRVDGQLVDVKFREGEFVRKGQLLAVIDPRPYQVQLDQAQAQLFKDQASLRDAQLNYQRYKQLLENSGAMSQQQVDTQQATVDQLEGAVRTDQANVDNAKLNLVYCHITAPESGRIGLRLVDPGNLVHASDTNPMLVITQLQPIAVVFTLPEDQLQTVAAHLRRGALPVEAFSRDDQTKLAAGTLESIDNEIDQTTGTGRLKAVFDNRDNELWPNQFVNIHLLLETERNVTVVPAAAIEHGPQGNYVFVVGQDNTAEVRPVDVSITEGNLSEIRSGVQPNELIVTDGQDKLEQGSRVQPHLQPATPAAQVSGPAGARPASATSGGRKPGQGQPGRRAGGQ